MLVFRGCKFSFPFLRLHGHWNPAIMHPDEAGAHAPRRIGSHVLGDAGGSEMAIFETLHPLQTIIFTIKIVSCPWHKKRLCQGKTAWFPTCTTQNARACISLPSVSLHWWRQYSCFEQIIEMGDDGRWAKCNIRISWVVVSNMFVFTPAWGNDLL